MRDYHRCAAQYSIVLACFVMLTVDSSFYNTVRKIRNRESGSGRNIIGNIGFVTKRIELLVLKCSFLYA